jgi:chemotaxis protein methyltransferase CheR
MKDSECAPFLQWALPRLGMRWSGFRKVRRQVCRRLHKRLHQLGLENVEAYRNFVKAHPAEWKTFDTFCEITMSRFYRDKAVFKFIERDVLRKLALQPAASENSLLRAWCAGCASGEEPYSLSLLWQHGLGKDFPQISFRLLATDTNAHVLQRARYGCYGPSSIHDVPAAIRQAAFFLQSEGHLCLHTRYREPVQLLQHDVRDPPPNGPFNLIMCRNLVFTYFDLKLQRIILQRLWNVLQAGGALILGTQESLPDSEVKFSQWSAKYRIYRKSA